MKPRFGRTDLPREQAEAMRKAVGIEVFTICYTTVTIVLIALVVGSSQAMRTAWIEDMLSLLPQIAFLAALFFTRRRPSRSFPFGLHRAMGVGHLVAGIALLIVGANLAVEAVLGFARSEHPTIGTVKLFGTTIWQGWLMIGVMALIVIAPPFYGRYKAKLARPLHNKLLHADADMAKADWQTNAASIVGVGGVGLGIWWLDYAAALFISLGILWDGWRNTVTAVEDLIDKRVTTYDDRAVHPLVGDVLRVLRSTRWVEDAGVRVRDLGQVLHVEAFVVPRRGFLGAGRIDLAALGRLQRRIIALDWKMQDVVVIPVERLPEEATTRPPDAGS
ncbi:cobalt transporter [Microbacterium sp. Root53]|uniref:cation transporter n=1 Tax=Microbacterium sp. Root53 TaxID=1736553 RepID=UPI0006FC20E5|nr:cation transporter [Microbacterium sp. Root53]KQZ11970.1 cobalt transporter [Microbacterium sp. Root53]